MKISKKLVSILLIVVLATTIFIVPVTNTSAKTNKLQTVTTCKQTDATTTSVTVKWNKIKNAKNYTVKLYTTRKGLKQTFKNIDTNTLYINNLTVGYPNYYIRIQAINGKNKSTFSKKFFIYPKLKKVKLKDWKSYDVGDNSYGVKFEWEEIDYAKSYEIYVGTADTKWIKKATVKKTYCKIPGFEKDKGYGIKIRAINSHTKGAYSTQSVSMSKKTDKLVLKFLNIINWEVEL